MGGGCLVKAQKQLLYYCYLLKKIIFERHWISNFNFQESEMPVHMLRKSFYISQTRSFKLQHFDAFKESQLSDYSVTI